MDQLNLVLLFGVCVFALATAQGPLEVLDNLDLNVLVSYIDYDDYYEYKFQCNQCHDLHGHQDVWYFSPGIFQEEAYWYPSPELPVCKPKPTTPTSPPVWEDCPKEEIDYNCSLAPPPPNDDPTVQLVNVSCSCQGVVAKYCCREGIECAKLTEDDVMTRTYDFGTSNWSKSPKCKNSVTFFAPDVNTEWMFAKCEGEVAKVYNCPHAPAPVITDPNLVIKHVACFPCYVQIEFCCKSFCNVFPVGSTKEMAYNFATQTWSAQPTCGTIPLPCPPVIVPPGSPIRVSYSDSSANKPCGSLATFTCSTGDTFLGTQRDVCGWGRDPDTGGVFPQWTSAKDQDNYSVTKPTPPGYCRAPSVSCPKNNQISCGSTKWTSTTVKWVPQAGWALDGPCNATCRSDGTWSEPTPKCVPCPCHERTIANGRVERIQMSKGCKCNYTYRVTCNPGYEPFGPTVYTCGPRMTPPFATSCVPKGKCGKCSSIPNVPNASITRVIATSAFCAMQVVYQCDSGYTMTGRNTAVCFRNVQRVPPPTCS